MRRGTARGLALALFAGWLLGVAPGARAQTQIPSTLPTDTDAGGLDVEEGMRREERDRPGLGTTLSRDVVQEGPIDPATYMLGPGDLLQLDLWGRLLRSVALVVSPEGKVFLPGSGPIDVTGRSLAWARQQILRQVSESFMGVHADVRLVRLRSFKVFITGFVKSPGAVEVTAANRASEAIRRVPLASEASQRNIEVRRRDGTVHRVDLVLAEKAGRLDFDPFLTDGDVIHVTAAKEYVSVTGAVSGGGTFERAPNDSLSTLITIAGGLRSSATHDEALLVRFRSPTDRETLRVDLRAIDEGQGNVVLRDGDRLFVQFQPEFHVLPTVEIYGEVNKPGAYPIQLGATRFSDLIEWSGGFRPLANRSAILLLRGSDRSTDRDPEFDRLVRLSRSEMTESEYAKFQTKLAQRKNSFRVDWTRVQRGGDDVNPLLQPGDLVNVDLLVSSVRVEGEVRRPGFVDFAPGRSLGEYVNLTGGYTDRASRRGVRISRAVTGQVIPARSLRIIQPGDFIWVPERKDVDAWQVFRDVVAVAGQAAVVIFTLSR